MNSPSDVKLSQIDTTGYDFGGTMTDEEIDAELDAMESEFEAIAAEIKASE